MVFLTVLVYAAALICANISLAAFGPWVSPINSFLLIGLDLALRDVLHTRLRWWQMAALILGTAVISWIISNDAGKIALAGAISFSLAGLADWAIFSKAKGSWTRRSTLSNTAGAAVDSVTFPLLAFGGFLPEIVAAQFFAKVIGSSLWVAFLSRFPRFWSAA